MVVLVTGSTRGIGKSLIIEYAKRGLDVIINYHNNDEDALKSSTEEKPEQPKKKPTLRLLD